ncbi:MAG: hypothetical protein ACI8PZ_005183 [Myxococcota bacterium]
MVRRIAVWSGPRSLSTAFLRSWENRADTTVWDEPLYAHYLTRTGLEHPAREAVVAAGETDWRLVARRCAEEGDAPLFVQKHMAHHLLPHIWGPWLDRLSHVILVRDPRRIVSSYVKSRAEVTVDDIGLPRLVELRRRYPEAPVVDSETLRSDPEAVLRGVCAALDVAFAPEMLAWPPGPRDSDGVWAPHWYASVWRSTGFAPPSGPPPALEGAYARVADAAMPLYHSLLA